MKVSRENLEFSQSIRGRCKIQAEREKDSLVGGVRIISAGGGGETDSSH